MIISGENFKSIRDNVLAGGRLLERNTWLALMEGKDRHGAEQALLAYRNSDGGFGNGIEPDLLLPQSTAIGAETALYFMDVLGYRDQGVLEGLANWALANLNDQGYINYPPRELKDYPHQPWWNNPDDRRILSVVGLLTKLGQKDSQLSARVGEYAKTCLLPEQLAFYDYPLFIYALHSPEFSPRQEIIQGYLALLPDLLERERDHFPLFTRYWSHALPLLDQKVVQEQRAILLAAFGEEGLPNPYPQLPWWQAPFTMDAVFVLKSNGLL